MKAVAGWHKRPCLRYLELLVVCSVGGTALVQNASEPYNRNWSKTKTTKQLEKQVDILKLISKKNIRNHLQQFSTYIHQVNTPKQWLPYAPCVTTKKWQRCTTGHHLKWSRCWRLWLGSSCCWPEKRHRWKGKTHGSANDLGHIQHT